MATVLKMGGPRSVNECYRLSVQRDELSEEYYRKVGTLLLDYDHYRSISL
jgi:hypothetical protein